MAALVRARQDQAKLVRLAETHDGSWPPFACTWLDVCRYGELNVAIRSRENVVRVERQRGSTAFAVRVAVDPVFVPASAGVISAVSHRLT